MKKSILLPLMTVFVAFLAGYCRTVQLAEAKDPLTLLFVPQASETLLLMGIVLGFTLVLGGFLYAGGRDLPNYTYTVYCPSLLFVSTVVTGSLFFVLSILVGLMDIKSLYDAHLLTVQQGNTASFDFPLTTLVTMILVMMAGSVMMYLGKQAYRGEFLKECWLTTIPAYLATARLMVYYRNYGAVTNFQDCFYPIMGSLTLVLALYHLCATAYIDARPRKIIFFSLVSVVFSAVNLASGESLYDNMLSLGFSLYMLAFSGAVLQNTYCSREDYRTPPVSNHPKKTDPPMGAVS